MDSIFKTLCLQASIFEKQKRTAKKKQEEMNDALDHRDDQLKEAQIKLETEKDDFKQKEREFVESKGVAEGFEK